MRSDKGRLDTSAGPFAVTLERERELDFTHGYVVSGISIAVVRSREADRWLVGPRGTLDANGAAPLRRRRHPDFPGRGGDVAPRAPAQRDVRGPAAAGTGLRVLVGRRDDGRRGLRRQGADHVLGPARGPLLDVRQPDPDHGPDGVRHGQTGSRRFRKGPGVGQPAQRRRGQRRGLGGNGVPGARGHRAEDLPERLRRRRRRFSEARSRRSSTVPSSSVTSPSGTRSTGSRSCPGPSRPSTSPSLCRTGVRCANLSTAHCGGS